MATRPAIFKWRQTEPVLILCAIRWYLRYSLSLRDVEELLEERGLQADHTTVWRWVPRYGPELDQRIRRHLKPTNKSWRVDETYVRVQGRWCYLYWAIDSAGCRPQKFDPSLMRQPCPASTRDAGRRELLCFEERVLREGDDGGRSSVETVGSGRGQPTDQPLNSESVKPD